MATNDKTQVPSETVARPTTQQPSDNLNSELSILNPTPEFLDNNFTVNELRKRCRDLGSTKVWVSKGQLINQIMNLTKSASNPEIAPQTNRTNETENIQNVDNTSDISVNNHNSETGQNSELVNTPTHNENNNIASNHVSVCDNMKTLADKIDKLNEALKLLSDRVASLESGNINTITSDTHPSNNSDINDKISDINKRVSALELSFKGDNTVNRIITLENKLKAVSESDNTTPNMTTKSKKTTLLIGDINLRHLKVSDFDDTCAIRTLGEANTDLLKCWVSEKLTWTPRKCMINSGLFDAFESRAPAKVIDNLSELICELKHKNEEMDIYVCLIAPTPESETLQAKINELNEHITKWASVNGVHIINPDLSFRLGTGEIYDDCFSTLGEHVGALPTLNRIGAVRLLSAIANQDANFNDCLNWVQIRKINPRLPHNSPLCPPPTTKHPQQQRHNSNEASTQPNSNSNSGNTSRNNKNSTEEKRRPNIENVPSKKQNRPTTTPRTTWRDIVQAPRKTNPHLDPPRHTDQTEVNPDKTLTRPNDRFQPHQQQHRFSSIHHFPQSL